VLGGALLLPTGFGQNIGTLTAIDARSGKTVWQNRFPESCYSGTVTTAGNLVFVGRNGGELEAYDARNGHKLWHFQTGAGANDTPTVFQLDGQEVLAFYAGGSALAASPHGDDVWLFSLRGKLGPAKPPGAGQGVQHAGEAPAKKNTAGDANAGKTVFAQNCATCHGATGHGGNGGPDLTSIPSAKQVSVVVGQVENGGGGMPPFKGTLSQKQINDVAAYVTQKITNAK
jgi:mono/diheme cytochrome c family protein